MVRFAALVVAALPLATMPVHAQMRLDFAPAQSQPPSVADRYSPRLPDDNNRYVTRKPGRILVGTAIAPNATFGVGFFESIPKYRGSAQERHDARPARSRKAGVGVVMKF